MKQIIVLEKREVESLRKGKTLVLSTLGGEVGIQFEREAGNGDAPEKKFRCICGAPFENWYQLNGHINSKRRVDKRGHRAVKGLKGVGDGTKVR